MEWFNEDGFLQHVELRKWLATNIDVIGQADKQVAAVAVELNLQDYVTSGALEAPDSTVTSGTGGTRNVRGRKTKKNA